MSQKIPVNKKSDGLYKIGGFAMSEIYNKIQPLRYSNEVSNKITKECLENAFLLLLKQQEFKEISITDICKKAGVSRPAYYRNYTSKEDVLHSSISSVVDNITGAMRKYNYLEDPYNFWLTMFRELIPHAETFKILLKAGLADEILTEINKFVREQTRETNNIKYYTLCFWSGAAYNIVREWIINGMDPPADRMAEEMKQLFAESDSPLFTQMADDSSNNPRC